MQINDNFYLDEFRFTYTLASAVHYEETRNSIVSRRRFRWASLLFSPTHLLCIANGGIMHGKGRYTDNPFAFGLAE